MTKHKLTTQAQVPDPEFLRLANKIVDAAQAWQQRDDEDDKETNLAIDNLYRYMKKREIEAIQDYAAALEARGIDAAYERGQDE